MRLTLTLIVLTRKLVVIRIFMPFPRMFSCYLHYRNVFNFSTFIFNYQFFILITNSGQKKEMLPASLFVNIRMYLRVKSLSL